MKYNQQYSIMALLLALVFSLPVAGADYDQFFYNGIQYIVLRQWFTMERPILLQVLACSASAPRASLP